MVKKPPKGNKLLAQCEAAKLRNASARGYGAGIRALLKLSDELKRSYSHEYNLFDESGLMFDIAKIARDAKNASDGVNFKTVNDENKQ